MVYKSEKIIRNYNLSDLFQTHCKSFKKIGYNLYTLRQTARLVLNPIMIESYAVLFSYRAVVQASGSMAASRLSLK